VVRSVQVRPTFLINSSRVRRAKRSISRCFFKFEFSIKYRCKTAAATTINVKPDAIDAKDLEGIFDATSNSNEILKERIPGQEGWCTFWSFREKERAEGDEEERSTSYPRFRWYLRVSVSRSDGCRTAGFTAWGQHICKIRNARVSSGPGATARLHTSRWMKVAAGRREEVAVDGCKLEIASPTVLRRLDLPTPTSLRPARPLSSLPGF